jgi:cytochrome P450
MRRVATDDVYLKDGHKIDKGTQLAVSNSWMWNSKFYEDPETFDAYRFVKLRQVSGREASANLVSVSPEHMAFGLGGHSCTGRFFAANHIKIVLCHILLKYEFRLADGSVPVPRRYGLRNQADPTAKIVLRRRRRRQEEIFLGDLAH